MIEQRLGLRRGEERPMESHERRGLGLPNNTWLVRGLRGEWGIRSGAKGLYIGELTRDQLRVLFANCEGDQ